MKTLKMIQEWGCTNKINDIAVSTYHRLLKLVQKRLLFHGQIYKLSYLHNLRIHES